MCEILKLFIVLCYIYAILNKIDVVERAFFMFSYSSRNFSFKRKSFLFFKRFVCVFVLLIALLFSSCAILFDKVEGMVEHVEIDTDRIYLPEKMGFNTLQVPTDATVYSVETSEDMFVAIQNELYLFSDKIYFEIESFDRFSQFWDELTNEAVLHSAFQEIDVYLEYDDRSPCLVVMTIEFNVTGKVLHHYHNGTLSVMKGYQEQKLYETVIDILDKVVDEDMTDREIAIALHNYIAVNTVYQLDDSRPELSTAYGVLVRGEGQCQGYSEAYTILMRFAGIKTRVISGGAVGRGASYESHAWNQVLIEGVWYHVDVTWNDPVPDLGDDVQYEYLLRSDEYFKRDHFWSDLFFEAPIDAPVL